MLKISEASRNDGAITLKLEGNLVGPWVTELCQICELMLAESTRITLDLKEVGFADENGIDALAGLNRRKVNLLAPSPFVAEQLKLVLPAVPNVRN